MRYIFRFAAADPSAIGLAAAFGFLGTLPGMLVEMSVVEAGLTDRLGAHSR